MLNKYLKLCVFGLLFFIAIGPIKAGNSLLSGKTAGGVVWGYLKRFGFWGSNSRIDSREQLLGKKLLAAASNGNVFEIRRLLDEGAAVNAVDNMGQTALICIIKGAVKIIDDTPNFSNSSFGLKARALSLYGKVISLLISAGANVDSADNTKQTSLNYFLKSLNKYAFTRCYRIIFQGKKESISCFDKEVGKIASLLINASDTFGDLDSQNIIGEDGIRLLINTGAVDGVLDQLLFQCTMNEECIRLLIKSGANVNAYCTISSKDGKACIRKTLLQYALDKKQLGVVKVLLENGSNLLLKIVSEEEEETERHYLSLEILEKSLVPLYLERVKQLSSSMAKMLDQLDQRDIPKDIIMLILENILGRCIKECEVKESITRSLIKPMKYIYLEEIGLE